MSIFYNHKPITKKTINLQLGERGFYMNVQHLIQNKYQMAKGLFFTKKAHWAWG